MPVSLSLKERVGTGSLYVSPNRGQWAETSISIHVVRRRGIGCSQLAGAMTAPLASARLREPGGPDCCIWTRSPKHQIVSGSRLKRMCTPCSAAPASQRAAGLINQCGMRSTRLLGFAAARTSRRQADDLPARIVLFGGAVIALSDLICWDRSWAGEQAARKPSCSC